MKNSPVDSSNFIINERAVEALNLSNPIGSELTLELDGRETHGTVIGVVRDFHFQSLHQPIRPLIFQRLPAYNFALMSVNMDRFENTISQVGTVWNEFDENFEFEYDFLDGMLGAQYAKEQKMGSGLRNFCRSCDSNSLPWNGGHRSN